MSQRIFAGLILSLATATSHAALLGRAPLTPGGTDYQAYYDDELNITWLADANLAATNTFGVAGICIGGTNDFTNANPLCPGPVPGPAIPSGAMDWYVAEEWIAAMNSAQYLGISNWRLPSMDRNLNGSIRCPSGPQDPLCYDNEMGYHYFRNGINSSTPSPFTNIASVAGFGYYGSSTEYAVDPSRRWLWNFGETQLYGLNPKTAPMWSWPVSPGDLLPVPVPAAAWLLGSALAVLTSIRPHAAR